MMTKMYQCAVILNDMILSIGGGDMFYNVNESILFKTNFIVYNPKTKKFDVNVECFKHICLSRHR